MRILVISLRRAKARRAAVAAQFGNSIALEFLDAIEGSALQVRDLTLDEAQYRLNTRRAPLPAELGCYASHRLAWQRCVDQNEPLIIMEDDCELAPEFGAALQLLEPLARRFGFIRLESTERFQPVRKHLRRRTHRLLERDRFELHYLADVPLCMLAYAINPTTAEALIRASATVIAPVDKFMQRTWQHGQPVFALTPAVVAPSPREAAHSYIGDRSRKSRELPLLLRRLAYKSVGELRRWAFNRRELKRLARPPSTAKAESAQADSG